MRPSPVAFAFFASSTPTPTPRAIKQASKVDKRGLLAALNGGQLVAVGVGGTTLSVRTK
jgi:hypothetical protein